MNASLGKVVRIRNSGLDIRGMVIEEDEYGITILNPEGNNIRILKKEFSANDIKRTALDKNQRQIFDMVAKKIMLEKQNNEKIDRLAAVNREIDSEIYKLKTRLSLNSHNKRTLTLALENIVKNHKKITGSCSADRFGNITAITITLEHTWKKYISPGDYSFVTEEYNRIPYIISEGNCSPEAWKGIKKDMEKYYINVPLKFMRELENIRDAKIEIKDELCIGDKNSLIAHKTITIIPSKLTDDRLKIDKILNNLSSAVANL